MTLHEKRLENKKMTEKNPKALNIPRYAAQHFGLELEVSNLAWISIGEPEPSFRHISNEILDKATVLKISFSDFTKLEDIQSGDFPPTKEIADEILNFILENVGKHFVVNCAAGVSRSGAICKFLQDEFDYDWPKYYQDLAYPNHLLYNLLIESYNDYNRIREEIE